MKDEDLQNFKLTTCLVHVLHYPICSHLRIYKCYWLQIWTTVLSLRKKTTSSTLVLMTRLACILETCLQKYIFRHVKYMPDQLLIRTIQIGGNWLLFLMRYLWSTIWGQYNLYILRYGLFVIYWPAYKIQTRKTSMRNRKLRIVWLTLVSEKSWRQRYDQMSFKRCLGKFAAHLRNEIEKISLCIWSHALKKSLMENFVFVQCQWENTKSYLHIGNLNA